MLYIYTRGGGRSQKLRRHEGYRLRTNVGHSNGGAAEGRAGERCGKSLLPQRESGGVTPGKILKLQMRNPAF